ncbi:putative bifunctional diguanylate cyclase/phosphodiesterase [Pandoraea anhela]|uniref:Phosphodiesterase n=1 Tax=Pandoraea anhela TaxID=2508295 RepID=A0A5E4S2A7_9BURK|nr:EAL domain-containing protein [Pandoraea anhela]VVD68209.1 phosphodiesterase [Pandoraea anhela]
MSFIPAVLRWRSKAVRLGVSLGWYRLRTKITLVFVALILVVLAVIQMTASRALNDASTAQLDEQLAVGQRVFCRALQTKADELTQVAQVVTADFGFREAVALHDPVTMHSALENVRERVHADVALLVDLNGEVIADSRISGVRGAVKAERRLAGGGRERGGSGGRDLREARDARDLKDLSDLRRDGADPAQPRTSQGRFGGRAGASASSIGMLDARAYELVSVPVKAPLIIGWVTMGFSLDDAFARDMHELSGLEVSLVHRGVSGQWEVVASSLHASDRAALQAALTNGLFHMTEDAGMTRVAGYALKVVNLSGDGAPVVAVLQRSLTEAAGPFRQLRSTLLWLTLGGIVISILGAALIARSVTRPLASFVDLARRIGKGDYAAAIDIRRRDETGDLARAFDSMRNAIALREERITELAYVDTLTGLPNRAAFSERMQTDITQAYQGGAPFAVILMDMDRFKDVNDTLGHHVGDRLLWEAGHRLSTALKDSGYLVARLGGDEFAILVRGGDQAAAHRCATRLASALDAPIVVEGQTVDVGASFGIAVYPDHGADMHTLLRRADLAMYVAKRSNLGVAVYEPDTESRDRDRLSLMSDLRHAIEHGGLYLCYQPQVDLSDGRAVRVEALVRWRHPKRGIVPPAEFIPFAEQTGFIRVISRWVAAEAVAACAAWHARGVVVGMSINLSARDLVDTDLPDYLKRVLREHALPPHWLCVEITESALMDDPEQALITMQRLHRMGVRIAIDDFGTGYSSLSYLKRMPVEEIKIDRSFVKGMAHEQNDALIVRSTIALGHSMGIRIVAEGIEDAVTLETLRALGCDYAQGYFLSKPLPDNELETWALAWQAENGEKGEVCVRGG